MKKKGTIRTIIVIIIIFWTIWTGHKNSKLQENVATILFEDQKITAINIGPGECIFTVNEQRYILKIPTNENLKYVDMTSLLSENLQYKFEYQVWYRIHGTHGNERRDPFLLSFKKINKGSDNCAEKTATISKKI